MLAIPGGGGVELVAFDFAVLGFAAGLGFFFAVASAESSFFCLFFFGSAGGAKFCSGVCAIFANKARGIFMSKSSSVVVTATAATGGDSSARTVTGGIPLQELLLRLGVVPLSELLLRLALMVHF